MAGQLALIEGVPAASETEGQDVEFKLLLAVGLAAWTYIVHFGRVRGSLLQEQ